MTFHDALPYALFTILAGAAFFSCRLLLVNEEKNNLKEVEETYERIRQNDRAVIAGLQEELAILGAKYTFVNELDNQKAARIAELLKEIKELEGRLERYREDDRGVS